MSNPCSPCMWFQNNICFDEEMCVMFRIHKSHVLHSFSPVHTETEEKQKKNNCSKGSYGCNGILRICKEIRIVGACAHWHTAIISLTIHLTMSCERERKWERNIVCACVCVGEWMMKITFSVAFHCFVLLLLFFRLIRKHTTPEAVSVHIYAWSGRIHIATESSHSKHTVSVCMYGWERERKATEREWKHAHENLMSEHGKFKRKSFRT